MARIISILFLILFSAASFGQLAQNVIVTNLSDELHTKITIDQSSGIDINRLNRDSIHADRHKRRHTKLKDMSVKTLNIRKVLMVRPYSQNDGEELYQSNILVNTLAIKKLDVKNMLVDRFKTKHFLIDDLNPFFIDPTTIQTRNLARKSLYLDKSICSYLKNLSINPLNIYENKIKDVSLYDSSIFSINTFDFSSIYSSFAINGIKLDNTFVNNINVGLESIKELKPQLASIDDNGFSVPVIVVDNSKYSVAVTEQTYAELAEMKIIYSFEQKYGDVFNGKVRLNDIMQIDKDLYLRWIQILQSNSTCNISFIKNKKIWKIISEAWLYKDRYDSNVKENMLKNLSFFKENKYDTVLVRFDCTEDIDKLLKMIDDIKNTGFEVFATYVGRDYSCPRWNPFIDPDTIERYIQLVAPKCKGFLLNWRGTSNHAKILPIEFFNYMCNILRKYNDQILIYGEVYYGYIDPLHNFLLVSTCPQNATGVVINNVGFRNSNVRYAVNRLFIYACPNYTKIDKLGQVVGYGPYYCSRPGYDANLSLDDEYASKKAVEKAYNKTGHGTVTLSHDGVDDHFTWLIDDESSKGDYNTTDNILYDKKIQEELKRKTKKEDKIQ